MDTLEFYSCYKKKSYFVWLWCVNLCPKKFDQIFKNKLFQLDFCSIEFENKNVWPHFKNKFFKMNRPRLKRVLFKSIIAKWKILKIWYVSINKMHIFRDCQLFTFNSVAMYRWNKNAIYVCVCMSTGLYVLFFLYIYYGLLKKSKV